MNTPESLPITRKRGPDLRLALLGAEPHGKTGFSMRWWRQLPNRREDNGAMQSKSPTSPPTAATSVRRVFAGTTALTLALLSGGCGGHDPRNTLPSNTPVGGAPGSSAPSLSPSTATPKDAVVAAYTGFFSAVSQALQSPPERTRTIVQGYASGSYLDFEIRQVVDHQARHLEPWGKAVVHVTDVELNQGTAKVHDCQDASNAGLADARTHQLVPQSRGTAHRNLIAEMTLGGDGRWRLTDLKQYRTACHGS